MNSPVANPKLARALRDLSNTLRERIDAFDDDNYDQCLIDTLRLCEACIDTLAHIANGMDVVRAFGAPGEWGYGTPIGDGVWAYYQPAGIST